jgi:IclR family pca regulon transcriptional regulator
MHILERDTMGGLAKGLQVIETFTATRPRQSISEVSSATGLDRATARRCLLTLAYLGYADYDGKYFTLTPRVLRLGTACLATMPLPQVVQPLLDQLSDELGESSYVSILDGLDVVYVALASVRKVLSVTLMLGSRLPAFCTSTGRVLLASMDESAGRQLVMASPLMRRTPYTLTDPDEIMSELGRIRANGYALIDQEFEIGLRSIGVPLLNARGDTLAAMNIAVPAIQTNIDQLVDLYLPAMLRVQDELRGVLR